MASYINLQLVHGDSSGAHPQLEAKRCGGPPAANEIKITHLGTDPGVCWEKRDELGEAMVKLTVNYTTHSDQFQDVNDKVLLTGPREISLEKAVDVLGRVISRFLRIGEISVNMYIGFPEIRDRHIYYKVELSRD